MSSSLCRLFCTSLSTTKPKSTSIKDIVNSLFKERNLNKLVQKFKESSECERFRSRHRVYQVTVRRLASAKRFQSIEEILEQHKKYPDIASEGFAMRIINLYGRAGMFDHASKMFDEMPELKCNRTVKSFNALLNACVDSQKYDKVEELFKKLPSDLKVTPDHFSYNIMIRSYCEMGSLDQALLMLDEMEKKGLKPTLITFNTLLNALFDDGNRFSDAVKIWGRMEKSGIVPDIRSFNAKLRGLVNVGKLSEAVKLLEELKNNEGKTTEGKEEETGKTADGKEKEMGPDVFSYTALIQGYCTNGNLEEAKKIYDEMLTNDILPIRSTTETLVPCLCEKGDFDLALKLCSESIKRNCYVAAGLLQTVIDGLFKESKIEQAKNLAELAWSKSYSRKSLKLPSDAE